MNAPRCDPWWWNLEFGLAMASIAVGILEAALSAVPTLPEGMSSENSVFGRVLLDPTLSLGETHPRSLPLTTQTRE